MGVFQADPWKGKNLPSWSPELWSSYLYYCLLSRSYTLPSNFPCCQGCPWLSHPWQVLLCSYLWGPADCLVLSSPLSGPSITCVRWLHQQCTPEIAWFPHAVLCFLPRIYWSSPSWGPGPMNLKLPPVFRKMTHQLSWMSIHPKAKLDAFPLLSLT